MKQRKLSWMRTIPSSAFVSTKVDHSLVTQADIAYHPILTPGLPFMLHS